MYPEPLDIACDRYNRFYYVSQKIIDFFFFLLVFVSSRQLTWLNPISILFLFDE